MKTLRPTMARTIAAAAAQSQNHGVDCLLGFVGERGRGFDAEFSGQHAFHVGELAPAFLPERFLECVFQCGAVRRAE
jgi:hypothetical protein